MENLNVELIGSGALYPIELTPDSNGNTGWHIAKGDPKLIEENLTALINYQIGERFRQEDFGTRLWECIEEPNSQAQEFLVKEFLKRAIEEYEPRVTFKSSSITREGSSLTIHFQYIVNSTGSSRGGTVTYNNN